MSAISGVRSVRLRGASYPVILPSRSDPRLHIAAVIVAIHVIGITSLGFETTVPQIVVAILAGALVDVLFTLRSTGRIVWPASGMLTGSGVALILRLAGEGPSSIWAWSGWHLFALVSAFAVVSKHLVRRHGEHLFNPSNFALVAAFVILGRGIVEPLDFWWAPMDVWMGLTYLIIIGGGWAITRRLGLTAMAVAFWITLVLALGAMIAGGHCMSASWSLTPVCGSRFWWALATSPEILVFGLFMITDPKTIPTTNRGRIGFAVVVGVVAALLIAPQQIEFWAKVGLLASLVIATPFRNLFDELPRRLASVRIELLMLFGSVGVAAAAALVIVVGIPAQQPVPDSLSAFADDTATEPTELPELPDLATIASIPVVTVDPAVARISPTAAASAQEIASMLVEDLWIEHEALLRQDPQLLPLASAGQRLIDMRQNLEQITAGVGTATLSMYVFDTLRLLVVEARDGQSSALGLEVMGQVEESLVGTSGAQGPATTRQFHGVFIVRQLGGDRWRIVHLMDPDEL